MSIEGLRVVPYDDNAVQGGEPARAATIDVDPSRALSVDGDPWLVVGLGPLLADADDEDVKLFVSDEVVPRVERLLLGDSRAPWRRVSTGRLQLHVILRWG